MKKKEGRGRGGMRTGKGRGDGRKGKEKEGKHFPWKAEVLQKEATPSL